MDARLSGMEQIVCTSWDIIKSNLQFDQTREAREDVHVQTANAVVGQVSGT